MHDNIHLCVCVCVSESEYRPLLPFSESTSQILLSSLNPVDNRKWRRKPWSWRVFKVLKVCMMIADTRGSARVQCLNEVDLNIRKKYCNFFNFLLFQNDN